jgi:2-dehydro-3-deoxyphosphooctonate aldolase (KDO 8-P synthase)
MASEIPVGPVVFGGKRPLVLIAGPCVIESEAATLRAAEFLKKLTDDLGLPLVFKASYDKANRSSIDAFRGPGLEKGLAILKKVRSDLHLPVISDVHDIAQAEKAAEVLDIIQIPAFLCRQTDLLVAAAKTGAVISVKKGQFMAPWDMQNVIGKIEQAGGKKILLTERGVSFGYNNLVSDMRSLVIMRGMGYPVIFDATHSVQLPGSKGGSSGGERRFVDALSRAAVGVGIDALFWEVHENPSAALCDGPNSIPLDELKDRLQAIMAIDNIVKNGFVADD